MSPDTCDPVCPETSLLHRSLTHLFSDTGDRPYKCQFCGDQFARRCAISDHLAPISDHLAPICLSDLLSRHVNKCHANEKPLPSTGPRKKGSVSASRATTSKQVCDQCVQANSSCDGSNPCGQSFFSFLSFLLLILKIQQNAFNVDIDALLLNSTVRPHLWAQGIPSVRELNRPHQALTLYLPHHRIIHHINNNLRMNSSSVQQPL
jgi:hypothetical protein